jgi:hypothetical protein
MGRRTVFACGAAAGVLVLAACVVTASAAESAEIPPGTHVLLHMSNSITTRTAQNGDYVYLRTASPIGVSGRTVVPVGSYVQGIVSHVRRSGRVSGRAELGIRLETVTLPRGEVLKFSPRLRSVDSSQTDQKVDRGESAVKQGGSKGHDTGQVVIYAGRGAAIGGIADRSWKGAGIGAGIGSAVGLATVLVTRGKEVELRQGSSLDVVFDRPLLLQ